VLRSPRFLAGLVGIAGTIATIAYCGRLAFYFFDVGGSWQGASDIGLGPTTIGLGAIGLLFCLVLTFKLFRLFGTPRAPGGQGGSGSRTPVPPSADDGDGFDADAVISRYLAQRPAAGQSVIGPAPTGRQAPVAASGFGRRIR
jgi:hypothetical protein